MSTSDTGVYIAAQALVRRLEMQVKRQAAALEETEQQLAAARAMVIPQSSPSTRSK